MTIPTRAVNPASRTAHAGHRSGLDRGGIRLLELRCATGDDAHEWTLALARELEPVRREFPCVPIRATVDPARSGAFAPPARGWDGDVLTVPLERWRDEDFDPGEMDPPHGLTDPVELCLCGSADDPADVASIACAALTRLQHRQDRRNEASRTPVFDALLDAHAALHDRSKPLVDADYVHALDTWQWVLRLDPDAGAAVQAAALFHDVERLQSEADVRREHHAADYGDFKDMHAAIGARIAARAFDAVGLDASVAARAASLIRGHERRGSEGDAALLGDADALSFFSLNASGFIRYYGPVHTARKIAHALARMRPAAIARLTQVRMRRDFEDVLRAELARLVPPDFGDP